MVPEQVSDWNCCSYHFCVLFCFLFLGPLFSVLSFLLWNSLWLVKEVLTSHMEISWFLWEVCFSASINVYYSCWGNGVLIAFMSSVVLGPPATGVLYTIFLFCNCLWSVSWVFVYSCSYVCNFPGLASEWATLHLFFFLCSGCVRSWIHGHIPIHGPQHLSEYQLLV